MTRRATSNFTLSDGLFIPKGSYTAVSNFGSCYNEDIYPLPYEFQPWRFSEAHMQAKFVATSEISLPFGHGIHACPVSNISRANFSN